MTAYQIAVVNNGGVPQLEVETFAAACDEWLNKELFPAWGFAGSVRAVPLGSSPESGEVAVTLTDKVSDEDALAFHNRTLLIAGGPSGTVELTQCVKYGVPWTSACCHEIAEIFGNPLLGEYVTASDGKVYARELADFVTSDHMPGLAGVVLCNAVTPAFFDPNPTPGARFDLMGNLKASIAAGVPPGGWAQWKNPDGTTASAYGDGITPAMQAYVAEKRGRAWAIGRKLIGAL